MSSSTARDECAQEQDPGESAGPAESAAFPDGRGKRGRTAYPRCESPAGAVMGELRPDRPRGPDGRHRLDDQKAAGDADPPLAATAPDPSGEGEDAALVRPYQWTAGRTTPTLTLDLEAMVCTSEKGQDEARLLTLEHRAVAALCRHPHAVAEVAAKLSVPLGVVRVVLSDMAEQGLIAIHRTVAEEDMAAHLVLMERVLSGLRRL